MTDPNQSNLPLKNHTSDQSQARFGSASQGDYNWGGVMDFIKQTEMKAQEREHMLIKEKRILEERVERLEKELKGQKVKNDDMVKKINVLEFSLRQHKKKGIVESKNSLKVVRHQRGNSDGVQALYAQKMKLATNANHNRQSSSGSTQGAVKTLEDNLEGQSSMNHTLEIYGEHSMQMSKTFHQQPKLF
jgi:hypothetical protein